MQVAVFHPGTQHSWQTALALQQLERLAWYATSIYYQPDRLPYRLERMVPGPIGRRLHAEFRRFSQPALDPAMVRTGGLSEWFERIAARCGMPGLAGRIDAWGNRRFVGQIASAVGSPEPFALWGYSGSAVTGFELAREHGRLCILDRTMSDQRVYNALMAGVREQYGDWFLPFDGPVPQWAIDRDVAEYALADVILTGSPVAMQTIAESEPDPAIRAKLRVLNYCYDEALFADVAPPVPLTAGEPVKFLFMGAIIPRKGVQHLLEAIARIPASQAELTLVGDMKISARAFAPYAERVTWHPTVARADVSAIMAAHHVLVLPSYFEGAGIVLFEALAANCALIQSNRCAPVATADTGIVLDRLDSDCLHDAMVSVIEDRQRLDHWRTQARKSADRFSFARYRDSIAAVLADLGI